MNKEGARHFGILISFLICSAAAAAVSLWQMSVHEDSLLGGLKAWSNGCFTAAVFWCSFGLLMLIASFDGFRGMQYLGYAFRFKWSKSKNGGSDQLQSYYDYMKKKRETRREGRIIRIFLIPGGIYLAAAAVLTIIFERMK